MIGRILRKDLQLLWPLVLLVILIQACLQWAWYKFGFFGQDLAARELLHPLTVAWFAGIVGLTAVVVQQDAVPALDQDWLIRPLERTHLLLAKLVFVVLTICVPMFVLDVARALTTGFPLSASLPELAFKELLVIAWLLVPVLALATLTASAAELLLVGGALIGVYAVGLSVAALLWGGDSCPTCDSGVAWLQHLLQHAGVLLGACVILALQYYQRRTQLARAVAVIGAVLLVYLQLPWSAAFAWQTRLSPEPGSAARVGFAFASQDRPAAGAATAANPARLGAGQAARALLAGNLNQAAQYLQNRVGKGATDVPLQLPVRIDGVRANERLLVDQSQLTLWDAHARKLYSTVDVGVLDQSPVSAGDPAVQQLLLPEPLYRRFSGSAVRLRLDYSLTLVRLQAQERVPALTRRFQAASLGRCATTMDAQGLSLSLRCKKLGPAPFCLSVTLYGAQGRHNPEVLNCDPDYRPDLPSLTYGIGFYGLDLPVHDRTGMIHYPVERTELGDAYVLIRVYTVREHFTRALDVPIKLEEWHVQS
ncbi:MAG TPA: hypothetical protein VMG11_10010 [Steroidobacteraceae bacterium]|nr:hypothetical protein [Steroidobacteraceae bacterium]